MFVLKATLLSASLMLLIAMSGCATTYVDPVTKMKFVPIKGGWYEMGSNKGNDEEKPVHDVCVSDFWIGTYEVKQSEWNVIMGSNPSMNRCGDDCPVENVSWLDAQEFIRKLNEKSGASYRLPTEAEWEYAARSGGKDQKWAGTSESSALGDYSRYYDNSANTSNPVGTRKPNGLSIYDMSGNVYEWCQDAYDETYFRSSPAINPPGAATDDYKVAKGGSGRAGDDQVRVSYRFGLSPREANRNTGLRLAFVDRPGDVAPCQQVASVYTQKGTPEPPLIESKALVTTNVEGTWINPNSGSSIYFASDGKGLWNPDRAKGFDWAQYEQMADFSWTMTSSGDLTITHKNPFGSNLLTSQGRYDSDREQICLNRDDEKCAILLVPVYDKFYRDKLKRKLPPAVQTGGRYIFTEETVKDTATGLVWAREGDLAGTGSEEKDMNQLQSLVIELNAHRYGGRSDWRLPRYSEMKTLIDSVDGGSPTPDFSNGDKINIRLNDIGFIAVKSDGCYLTSDLCKQNYSCSIDLANLSSNCDGRNTDFLPVAGRDFRTAGKVRRAE